MLVVGAGHVLVPAGLLSEEEIEHVPEFLRLGTGKSKSHV